MDTLAIIAVRLHALSPLGVYTPLPWPNFAGQLSRNVSYNLVSFFQKIRHKTIVFIVILQL